MKKVHFINKKGDIVKTEEEKRLEEEEKRFEEEIEIWWKRFSFKNSRFSSINKGFYKPKRTVLEKIKDYFNLY